MTPNPNRKEVYFSPAVQPVQPVVAAQPVMPVEAVPVQPVQPVVAQPVVAQPVVPVEAAPVVDNQQSYASANGVHYENNNQQFVDANGNMVESQEEVVVDKYGRQLETLDRVNQIVYLLSGALMVLLALRLFMRLLGASAANGFVNFIYNLSGAFVAPFNGIFNDQAITSGSIVEFSTIIAILVYAMLTVGLVKLLEVLFSPRRYTKQVYATTRHRKY